MGFSLVLCPWILFPPSLIKFDARVYNFVHDIAQQIHEDHDDCEEDRGGHDHRIITVGDRLYKLLSESADVEDVLDDEGAGENVGKHRANVGDDRNERVAERMFKDDLAGRNAFCSCRTDVILAQGIQHTGLGKSGDVRCRVRCEGDDRQNIFGSGCVRREYGEPSELDTEDHQKQCCKYEGGHCRKECSEEDDQSVRPMVAEECRDGAEDNADDHCYECCDAADLCRDGKAGAEGPADLTSGLQGYAEVEAGEILYINKELLPYGLVQIKAFHEDGADCRGGGLFGVEGAAGNRVHGEERDEQYDKYAENCQKDTFNEIF